MSEKLKLINMADVTAQNVRWLWYPYVPFGKITMLMGDPGEGKTMLVLALAAMITKGELLPGERNTRPPVSVIYQTAEDGLADTIKPRLEKAGADCKMVVVIDDSDCPLSFSDSRIEEAIKEARAKLLILDPLQAFLGADVDMHRANEVRPAFRNLADIADRLGCAVIIVGHMNKMSGIKSIYRGLGSIDIAAVCRSILLIGRSRDDDGKRYLVQLKNSLAPAGESLAFQMDDSLSFIGTSDITADKLLYGGAVSFTPRKADVVTEKLRELLIDGERRSDEIYEIFREMDISSRTVEKAKKKMGVVSKKHGGHFYLSLPPPQNIL